MVNFCYLDMQEEQNHLFLGKLSCYLALGGTGYSSFNKDAHPEETAQSQTIANTEHHKRLLLTFPDLRNSSESYLVDSAA